MHSNKSEKKSENDKLDENQFSSDQQKALFILLKMQLILNTFEQYGHGNQLNQNAQYNKAVEIYCNLLENFNDEKYVNSDHYNTQYNEFYQALPNQISVQYTHTKTKEKQIIPQSTNVFLPPLLREKMKKLQQAAFPQNKDKQKASSNFSTTYNEIFTHKSGGHRLSLVFHQYADKSGLLSTWLNNMVSNQSDISYQGGNLHSAAPGTRVMGMLLTFAAIISTIALAVVLMAAVIASHGALIPAIALGSSAALEYAGGYSLLRREQRINQQEWNKAITALGGENKVNQGLIDKSNHMTLAPKERIIQLLNSGLKKTAFQEQMKSAANTQNVKPSLEPPLPPFTNTQSSDNTIIQTLNKSPRQLGSHTGIDTDPNYSDMDDNNTLNNLNNTNDNGHEPEDNAPETSSSNHSFN